MEQTLEWDLEVWWGEDGGHWVFWLPKSVQWEGDGERHFGVLLREGLQIQGNVGPSA